MRRLSWSWFLFKVAARNLRRSPRRTVISVLAIAVGAAALILFESFVLGVKTSFRRNIVRSQFGHYQVFNQGYRQNKSHDPFGYQIQNPSAVRHLIEEKIGKLAFFSGRVEFFGLLSVGDRTISAKGIGIDAREENQYLTLNQAVEGEHLAAHPAGTIYLGYGLAQQLATKTGQTITLVTNTASGSLNAADLEVVGVYRTGIQELDENIFFLDLPVAQKLLRVTGASKLLFAFPDDNELNYQAALKEMVPRAFPGLEVLHWHELIGEYFDNSMGWLQSQFAVFRVIILIVATLSILNVFMISLLERTGEFGTLRAIGTYRGEVLALIFIESVLQAALGALAGVLLGGAIIELALARGLTMPPPPDMSVNFHVHFAIPWQGVWATLALCTLVAGGAGIFPAIKMARMNIVEALGRNV